MPSAACAACAFRTSLSESPWPLLPAKVLELYKFPRTDRTADACRFDLLYSFTTKDTDEAAHRGPRIIPASVAPLARSALGLPAGFMRALSCWWNLVYLAAACLRLGCEALASSAVSVASIMFGLIVSPGPGLQSSQRPLQLREITSEIGGNELR
jgi:hypothetical protein